MTAEIPTPFRNGPLTRCCAERGESATSFFASGERTSCRRSRAPDGRRRRACRLCRSGRVGGVHAESWTASVPDDRHCHRAPGFVNSLGTARTRSDHQSGGGMARRNHGTTQTFISTRPRLGANSFSRSPWEGDEELLRKAVRPLYFAAQTTEPGCPNRGGCEERTIGLQCHQTQFPPKSVGSAKKCLSAGAGLRPRRHHITREDRAPAEEPVAIPSCCRLRRAAHRLHSGFRRWCGAHGRPISRKRFHAKDDSVTITPRKDRVV